MIEEKYYVVYEWYSTLNQAWVIMVEPFNDYQEAKAFHEQVAYGDAAYRCRNVLPLLTPFQI